MNFIDRAIFLENSRMSQKNVEFSNIFVYACMNFSYA